MDTEQTIMIFSASCVSMMNVLELDRNVLLDSGRYTAGPLSYGPRVLLMSTFLGGTMTN